MQEKFIARCFELAKLGETNAFPNPIVGAVIVHNEKVIGEGFHRICGPRGTGSRPSSRRDAVGAGSARGLLAAGVPGERTRAAGSARVRPEVVGRRRPGEL